ncbi:two component system sensor kinase [Aeromonas jandaei]|uniref:two component system sensor kinase n=1 Tax=Aeromonas jandaei TaxID=650 RepID=UPI001115C7D5|nr:two component system sensor kinase [Aeromonas jandaei]TNH99680.1 hybrid sensor histidine kinase/response regulator [Aeromonas jandaei]
MVRIPKSRSYSFRLALLLSGVVTLFWLVVTSVVLQVDFEQNKQAQQRNLITQVDERASALSVELIGVERDVMTLMQSWQKLGDTDLEPRRYLEAHYIADGESVTDSECCMQRALAFIEAYGSGGLGSIIDTFIVLKKGVVISNASDVLSDTPYHQSQFRALRKLTPQEGLYWGRPFQEGEHWHMLVAKRDSRTGVTIGMTIQLSPVFGNARQIAGEDNIWLGREGHHLIRNQDGIQIATPDCLAEEGINQNGRFVVCREILPVQWQLQFITKQERVYRAAFATLQRHLLFALSLLIVLVGLIYLVLQRSLGRTLQHVLNKINPVIPLAELAPLSEKGGDERMLIAQAYNRMLRAVKMQYAELEQLVAERTCELEEAKRQAELASEHKSEHLNSISHEIRTPLNGIIGTLTLLIQGDASAEQQQLLDTGLKCSRHLLEIINNLLDFSRIDSGQMVVVSELLDPLPMIDQAMLTVQLPAIEKGLTLHCLLEPSFPDELYTDGLRLRQILINLLGNAVKFTSCGKVALLGWSEQERICFRITDTGPGIHESRADDVFVPFHQVDNHKAGSGLGLPIARSLARMLGGELYLEKALYGASFLLELPLAGSRVANIEEKGSIVAPSDLHQQLTAWGYKPVVGENPELEGRELSYLPERLRNCLDGRTIARDLNDQIPVSAWSLQLLLVDDVNTNRDIVGRMLRQQGHKVYLAASGEEALQLGREHIFDLVFMDMRMPGLSGEETLHLWRDESNGILDPDCPIMALTANAQPGERQRLRQVGFNDYLTKPVTPILLSRALDFAADLQLERGVELALNEGGDKPILGEDPLLRERLGQDLDLYLIQLEQAIDRSDNREIQRALHTIKGLAGQGGLNLVHEAIRHWEQLIEEKAKVPEQALDDLRRLVHSELAAD